MKKLTVLVAAAAGYVLGTRAGRERYEQIKRQVTKTWNNPKVQETVDVVQDQAKQTGADVASAVGSKVSSAASDVKAKVTSSTPEPVDPVPPTEPVPPVIPQT